MKNILFIITLILICTSCSPTPQRNMIHLSDGDVVELLNIDGCQYFKCYTYNQNYVYTHKGNCTNSIHIYNVEKR